NRFSVRHMIQALERRTDTKHRGVPFGLRAPVLLLLGLLAIAPLGNIVAIITTTGADNLSNDYLAYTWMVRDVLAGTYNWSHYFRDTFYRTHSVALPVFIHIGAARFFHWSIYPELYLGIAIAAVRVLLLWQVFSRSAAGWRKWWQLPTLSLLVFSASQISVYAFGHAALTIGLTLSGFALRIWALLCQRQPAAALLTKHDGALLRSQS